MEGALGLGQYALGHALRVFRSMGADPAAERALKLWRAIRAAGWERFRRRDLWQRVKGGRIASLEDVDSGLEVLLDHGHVARFGGSGGSNPRSEEYAVNPKALAGREE
jgi:hypothetical protein